MNYEKLISDVNLAFAGNQFEVSLKKAQESIDKKEIVKISLKDNIPKRNICLVYDSRHPVSSAARKLRKTIGEINYGEN